MIDDIIWKNKGIRNFLSHFKEEEGAKVIRSVLLLGIECLKKEGKQPETMTAGDIEEFTINAISAGLVPKVSSSAPAPPPQEEDTTNAGGEVQAKRPAGVSTIKKEASEDRQKRSSSVPLRLGRFTMKANNSWRKGDDSQGRDPWKAGEESNNWRESVYPKWWNTQNNNQTFDNTTSDEVDLKIEKQRAANEFKRPRSRSPRKRSNSPLRRSKSPPKMEQTDFGRQSFPHNFYQTDAAQTQGIQTSP